MLRTITLAGLLMLSASATAAEPKDVVVKGFVVALDAKRLTISNVPLTGVEVPKGAGPTFTMPQPKEGQPAPSWVAAEPAPAKAPAPAPKMRMMMVTSPDDKGANALQLTELETGELKLDAADYPSGTAVSATYREFDGRKQLIKLERAGAEASPAR